MLDQGRERSIPILLNVSFPRVPCYLVSLDVVNVAGELQVDVQHDIVRTRLDPHGQVIDSSKGSRGELHDVVATHEPNYCGNCYGATPDNEDGCCNSCDQVRQAYLRKGWSFPYPDGVEQCRAEHWTEKVQSQAGEGCNVAGLFHVNKVVGNIHISMGRSFQVNTGWMQTMVPYLQGENVPQTHDFGHVIHTLSFGGEYEFGLGKDQRPGVVQDIKHHLGLRDPLQGVRAHADQGNFMYQYYLKVVPTEYHTLRGLVLTTRQYSVTAYERDLNPGADLAHAAQVAQGLVQKEAKDAHRTFHGVRPTASVLFNYELSALKAVHTETSRSLAHFLGAVCAIVGGVLTMGQAIDSYLYRSQLKSAAKQAPRGTLSIDDSLGFAAASGKFL